MEFSGQAAEFSDRAAEFSDRAVEFSDRAVVQFNDPEVVCQLLDQLLENLVDIEQSHAPRFLEREATSSKESEGREPSLRADELTDRLAAWLSRLRATVGSVHPKAMEIIHLYSKGYRSRDIAERLDLGLRLLNRISRDAIAALKAAPAEG